MCSTREHTPVDAQGMSTRDTCQACRKLSHLCDAGNPAFNATCYCPYYTTKAEPISFAADFSCGPRSPQKVRLLCGPLPRLRYAFATAYKASVARLHASPLQNASQASLTCAPASEFCTR